MKLVSALILPLNFPNATVFVSQCRHKLNTPFYVYGHCRQFPEGKWQTTYRNSRTLGINMTRIYSSMKAIFASVFPSLSLLDSERNRRLNRSAEVINCKQRAPMIHSSDQ